MGAIFRGADRLGAIEVHNAPIQPQPHEPLATDFLDHVAEFSHLAADERGEQHDLRAGFVCEDLVDDGLRRLPAQRPPAGGIMRLADGREKQPQVIVDLGRRGDRRARVRRAGVLFEGDGRREALDEIDVRLFELVEELPGVGRKTLDVTPPALGIQRVESEARFARPARPGDDHELVSRNRQAEILQIVLARAPDSDSLLGHSGSPC